MGGVVQAVGGLFGGGNGGHQASAAPIISPVTTDQANQAYNQTQGQLTAQQQLAQALGQTGGIQNQQQVAQLLSQMSQGQGPNPAQNMLNQATGTNVSNQAALMAGQRGASADPGMIARLAAQQGAATQQQAAGQAATLGAQQQIGAAGALGNLAQQQIGNQMGAQQAATQGNLSEQQNLLNSIAGVNNANVTMQGNVNNANASMAQAQGNVGAGLLGGLAGGLSGGLSLIPGLFKGAAAAPTLQAGNPGGSGTMTAAHGGMVENPKLAQVPESDRFNDPLYPEHMKAMATMYHPERFAQGGMIDGESYANQMKLVPGKAKVKGDSLKNDIVPAKLSPGELIIPKSVMEAKDPLKEGTKFLAEALKKHGKGGNEESDFKQALSKAASKR